MKREIKFRAWDTHLKTYQCSGWGSKTFAIFAKRTNCPRFIIEQYTGLKDKNGKESYEGDILEHYVDFGPAGEKSGYHTAVKISPYDIGVQMWIFKEDGFLPTVIGNIHENPELLMSKMILDHTHKEMLQWKR